MAFNPVRLAPMPTDYKYYCADKIRAIKLLRDMAQELPCVVRMQEVGDTIEAVGIPQPMNLKDAKELVEAIMRLGAREYQRDKDNFISYNGNPSRA